jgi:protoporphyrinogen oxidase
MGTSKCLNCLNIGIVGAGVAGLTVAVELSLAWSQYHYL